MVDSLVAEKPVSHSRLSLCASWLDSKLEARRYVSVRHIAALQSHSDLVWRRRATSPIFALGHRISRVLEDDQSSSPATRTSSSISLDHTTRSRTKTSNGATSRTKHDTTSRHRVLQNSLLRRRGTGKHDPIGECGVPGARQNAISTPTLHCGIAAPASHALLDASAGSLEQEWRRASSNTARAELPLR